MEKNCGNNCENCPAQLEWSEEINEIEYDVTFLGDAVAESQKNSKRALNAFIDIAAQENFLSRRWNDFMSAQKTMDFDPIPLRKLAGELLEILYQQSSELKSEKTELAEGCSGPKVTEYEDEKTRTTVYTCKSPIFKETEGLEPSLVIRTPKE